MGDASGVGGGPPHVRGSGTWTCTRFSAPGTGGFALSRTCASFGLMELFPSGVRTHVVSNV